MHTALATHLSKILTVGIPGVNSWKRAAGVLKDIGAKAVRVAFDADARRNRTVARCLSHLIAHLRQKGFEVELELWNEADGKGIDDLLAAGKSPEVLTDTAAIDAAVAEIVTEAEKADPAPSGPPAGKACEAFDDPHLLARDYRKQFRFADSLETLYYHRQDWSRWDGRAYRVLDEKEIKAELTESIKAAFDREHLKHLARWKANGAEGSPPTAPKVTTKCVGNALQALAGMSLLRGLIEPPAWIGDCEREWAAGEMLACNNALVHLPSFAEGKEQYSIKPTPLFFSPNALDYHFDPNAFEPANWYAFLQQLWEADPQAIETLQEWFGYCLLPDTSQQKILMIVGPRRSGKGTIARILRVLIGIHNTASPTLASLEMNFGLQPLLNETLAIISDARLSGRTDAAVVTERLLSISGEDGQDVHRKHKSAVNLKLPVRFVILTNELPRLNDPSGALVGRLVLLRQTKSFYGQEDTKLTEKLLTELPEILLWAIKGWKRLQDRGHFLQPDSGAKLIQQMEDLSSPIGVFIRECCDTGTGCEISCPDLFSRWQKWCESKGNKDPGPDTVFGRDLHAAIPGLETKQVRQGSMRIRVYRGIKLKENEQETQEEVEEEMEESDSWRF